MFRRFIAQIHELFNNRTLRSLLLKTRIPLGCLASVLLISEIEREWFLPGVLVSLAGALLQLWCFGSLRTNKVLANQGPYSVVRNPMYLGRYILILGAIFFTGNIWICAKKSTSRECTSAGTRDIPRPWAGSV